MRRKVRETVVCWRAKKAFYNQQGGNESIGGRVEGINSRFGLSFEDSTALTAGRLRIFASRADRRAGNLVDCWFLMVDNWVVARVRSVIEAMRWFEANRQNWLYSVTRRRGTLGRR